MDRMKLVLEDVQVESFAIEADPTGPGTVHGLEDMAESGVHSFCETYCPYGTCLTVCDTDCAQPTCRLDSCFFDCTAAC